MNIGRMIRTVCFHWRLDSKNRQKITMNSKILGRVSTEAPQTIPTINQLIGELIRFARIIASSKSKLKNISNGTASNSNSKYSIEPQTEYIAKANLAVFESKYWRAI